MSAEADSPGLSLREGLSRVTTTSKSFDSWVEEMPVVGWIAELPISVTLPVKTVSGKASTRILAVWSRTTPTTSVSSTSTSTYMTDRSAMVRRTVPGLFIVPMMATSPSSTRRLVMTPSIGEL